jgi:hypothetical protein
VRRCAWPEGCEQWSPSDELTCYGHTKHIARLLDLKDPDGKTPGRPIVSTMLNASVLSDEQLEIAHLLSNLGADVGTVQAALQRRRVRATA